MSPRPTDEKIQKLLQENLEKLGIGPGFGLKLQSVTPGNRLRKMKALNETIVRVQLTEGRGIDATLLDNHGKLVFRADGTLADYHSPLPTGASPTALADGFVQAQALDAIRHAHRSRLNDRGIPLSIVSRSDGQLSVEARVMRGHGLNTYLEVFTLENPRGERREILIPPVPPNKRIQIQESLLK